MIVWKQNSPAKLQTIIICFKKNSIKKVNAWNCCAIVGQSSEISFYQQHQCRWHSPETFVVFSAVTMTFWYKTNFTLIAGQEFIDCRILSKVSLLILHKKRVFLLKTIKNALSVIFVKQKVFTIPHKFRLPPHFQDLRWTWIGQDDVLYITTTQLIPNRCSLLNLLKLLNREYITIYMM